MVRVLLSAVLALGLLGAANAATTVTGESGNREFSTFGGNCNDSFDNATAFAAATAWIATANNRVVQLPAGICRSSTSVTVGDGRQQSTTLTGAAAGTSISVSSCTGVTNGDAIAIRRDDGTLFSGVTASSCSAGTLTISGAYSGGAASSGNTVFFGKISTYVGGGFRGYGGCWSTTTNAGTTIKYTGTASPTTTLTANAVAGDRTLTVASISNINIGEAIGVTLDDASVFLTWVTETPTGTTVKIGNEIPTLGTSGNTVKLQGNPVARINGPHFGAVFEGVCLDANSLAAVGFDSRHSRQGSFRAGGLTVIDHGLVGHYLHPGEFYAGASTGAGGNEYELYALTPDSTKTVGCWVRGTPPIGPSPASSGGVAMSQNRFYGGTCRAGGNDARAAGILLEWADNNTWYKPFIIDPTVSSSKGLYIQPSYNGTNFPNENTFYSGAIIGGVQEGTATGGTLGGTRFPDYGIYDSEPIPTGSITISGTTSAGTQFGFGTPKDLFEGLKLSRTSATQINVAVGTATDSTGQIVLALSESCNASLATAGNIQGMDDATTRQTNTWYAVFIVGNTLTGRASCMLAQTTAAAVPAIDFPSGLTANWRYYAYVGRFKTDGTGSGEIATTSPILPRGQFYIDASDTYTPGASGFTPRAVRLLACGGGASGASGGRQASGSAISGGAGGSGGGCQLTGEMPFPSLASTIAVTVGAGGAAVTAPGTNDTAGTTGNPGNPTFFGASAGAAIAWGGGGCASTGGQLGAASASGGAGMGQRNTSGGITLCTDASGSTPGSAPTGGIAGSATTGTVSSLQGNGAAGAGGPAAGSAGPAGGHAVGQFSCPGGAAGGGISTAPAASNGGAGGGDINGLARPSGGTSGGAAGGSGAVGAIWLPGSAGAGGYGDTDGSPGSGNGGSGAQCAGGGGGGSTLNTFTAGNGGAGGSGYAFVWELR